MAGLQVLDRQLTLIGQNLRARCETGHHAFDVREGHRADHGTVGIQELNDAILGVVHIIDDIGRRMAPSCQVQNVIIIAAFAALVAACSSVEDRPAAASAPARRRRPRPRRRWTP